eukprot:scaffold17459_cov107-Amphora_coffeaeformis.AAC.1
METPFTLYSRTETEPSQTELEFYQVELNEFLNASFIANGDANSYFDAANQVINRPVRPANT